jgi:hypothetical protein
VVVKAKVKTRAKASAPFSAQFRTRARWKKVAALRTGDRSRKTYVNSTTSIACITTHEREKDDVRDKVSKQTAGDPLRKLLRLTVQKRNEAQHAVAQAETALQRANDLLRAKEADLAKYECIDALLAQHRLAVEKAHAASGGSEPRMVVPPDIIQRVVERDACQSEVDSVKSAVAGLQNDLDNAKAALSSAETKTSQAAAAVIAELAWLEAELLFECKREVWQHAASLRAAARLWVPDASGKMGPIRLPVEVRNSLEAREPRVAGPLATNAPEVAAANKWRGFHAALMRDAEARFESESDEANTDEAA